MNQAACLAVIPARGGSKGLPRKNILPCNGKPLIHYTIEAALNSGCIHEVVVSTDSEEIAHVSRLAGASVPFLRPVELATDHARSMDVLKHAVAFYEQRQQSFEHIMLLQPTSPLRDAEDIRKAYDMYVRHQADSLQSVALTDVHPYLLREMDGQRKCLQPYFQHEQQHLRRQDVKELYVLNGAIYIVRQDVLMNQHTLVGHNNYGYVMPKERSIDIDDRIDLKFAEWILSEWENDLWT